MGQDEWEMVLPHNEEAEKALLGEVIVNHKAIDAVRGKVAPDDFYDLGRGKLFGACLRLYDERGGYDAVTLMEALKRWGLLYDVGGAGALAEYMDYAYNLSRTGEHAALIYDEMRRRRIAEAAREIAFGIKTMDFKDIGKRAGTMLELAGGQLPERTWEGHIEDACESFGAESSGVMTGLPSFDAMGGLQPGELVIVGARPSVGKSSLLQGWALHQALGGIKVSLFSLESSMQSVIRRMLLIESGHEAKAWVKADVDVRAQMGKATARLMKAPLKIEAKARSPSVVRARARSSEHAGSKVIYVDYLQLLQADGRFESRRVEVGSISRALKALAEELQVPVVVACQLNRQVESRTKHRPVLADLRESGDIEQDADVVMFIHRPDCYQEFGRQTTGEGELIIAKNRNGPTGKIPMVFNMACFRIGELDRSVPYGEPPRDALQF